MLEAAKNSVFTICSNFLRWSVVFLPLLKLKRSSSHVKFLPINSKHPEEVAKRFRKYKETQALDLAEKNILSATENQLNEFEKKEFQILSKYWDEGHSDPAV